MKNPVLAVMALIVSVIPACAQAGSGRQQHDSRCLTACLLDCAARCEASCRLPAEAPDILPPVAGETQIASEEKP